VYDGRCTNCHEVLYIRDQYEELGMPLPAEDSEFMQQVRTADAEVARKAGVGKP